MTCEYKDSFICFKKINPDTLKQIRGQGTLKTKNHGEFLALRYY